MYACYGCAKFIAGSIDKTAHLQKASGKHGDRARRQFLIGNLHIFLTLRQPPVHVTMECQGPGMALPRHWPYNVRRNTET